MGFTQRIMRLLAPTCEQQRVEFRKARDCMNAHAEDLLRTTQIPAQTQLRQPEKKVA